MIYKINCTLLYFESHIYYYNVSFKICDVLREGDMGAAAPGPQILI